jgi:hypothetical protein
MGICRGHVSVGRRPSPGSVNGSGMPDSRVVTIGRIATATIMPLAIL